MQCDPVPLHLQSEDDGSMILHKVMLKYWGKATSDPYSVMSVAAAGVEDLMALPLNFVWLTECMM